MTREEAKELLPIIQAFAEGKTIQYKDNYDTWMNVSRADSLMLFDKVPSNYRIKPESKYRPFKNAEECWNEMLKHQPFGWVKNKKTGSVVLIGNIHQDKEVFIVFATNEESLYNAFDLLNEWFFADGTPFGIKED